MTTDLLALIKQGLPANFSELASKAVGESPGASKLTKAESLGIPILDEDAFVRLLDTGELPS